jgi:tetratricopeptide (TPR) repeat protein
MSEESKLVPFSRARRRPDPARVEEFAAMARKLQQERQSSDIVTTLLRDTPRAQWPFLANRTELRTAGVLERLGREVEARLDREPREALAIAELATAIADALPESAYPPIVIAQVRAHAWKDRGQALCYLARHDEALDALDRADTLLEPFGTLGHDLAIIRFVRASTLQEVHRAPSSSRMATRDVASSAASPKVCCCKG